MKISRLYVSVLAAILIVAMGCSLAGCAQSKDQEKPAVSTKMDLMADITPRSVALQEDLQSPNEKAAVFAVGLFKACRETEGNTLVSPLSVMYALAMTANGAQEETLRQMEAVLGMSTGELNSYLYSYMQTLPLGENCILRMANSIWFRDDSRFTVEQDFLQINADYYGAGIYKALFDEQTCREINDWVKENTDGMIPSVLDEIPERVLMYLINALAFEAKWQEPYDDFQITQGTFTQEDGTKQDAQFMHGTENIYLSDEHGTGFMKYYAGGKYAFVAMLPDEGVTVEEYVESLDGKALYALLFDPEHEAVNTVIPKFETEYSLEMSEILADMGMPDAFDPDKSDFGKLGRSTDGNIYITSVVHKTYLAVDENGTKAAAVTVVAPGDEAAAMITKEVRLDRPFVYMLVDCENHIPLFIGTAMNVNG